MRILVTGGAGYIGSITTRRLLDAGHEVVVVDSLVRGHRHAVDDRAEFVHAEVGDAATLSGVLPGCDGVLHIAGLIEVGESAERPEAYFDANVAQPARLLEAARDAGITTIVFSSTAAVYGEPDTIPIAEDAPTSPVNVYGATKLMFEQLLQWYEHAYGFRGIRLRYFNVAGASPDAALGEAHEPETHIIPRILRSIAAGERSFKLNGDDYPTPDGTCVRDYIHVCDLAEAHLLAIEHLAAGGSGGVFNLGDARGFSNREVLSMCGEVTGADIQVNVAERRPGDPAVLVASADRAREVLGWTPARVSLKQMIEDAWRWHSSERRWDSG